MIPEARVKHIASQIQENRAQIAEIEAAHKAALHAQRQTLIRLSLELWLCRDPAERVKCARLLYWSGDAPVWAIAAGMMATGINMEGPWPVLERRFKGAAHQLRRIVGPHSYLDCRKCGEPKSVPVASRQMLERLSKRDTGVPVCGELLCEQCNTDYQSGVAHSFRAAAQHVPQRRQTEILEAQELSRLMMQSGLPDADLERLYELIAKDEARNQRAYEELWLERMGVGK